ncbi:MAG: hypothetical protein ACMG6S_26295 [Byssovorax sp.]
MIAGVARGGAARADEVRACVAASEQAQLRRDEGKLKLAREQMLMCARESCPAPVRKDCAAWLAALDASVPTIVLSAQDEGKHDLFDVDVSLDGVALQNPLDGKAIPVDPGPHTLRFEARGRPPVEERVLVREGEKRRAVSVHLPASPGSGAGSAEPGATTAAPRVPMASIVLGGVGVAALGSFAAFGILGKNQLATLRETCGTTRTCAEADVDAARVKLIVADVSLGVAVASLGVATVLFFTHGAKAKEAAAVARTIVVTPMPGGGSVGVDLRF